MPWFESSTSSMQADETASFERRIDRKSAILAADDIRVAGFARAPPAVLECTAGTAVGHSFEMVPSWQSRSFTLGEDLNPAKADHDGIRLTNIAGVCYVQPLTAASELWVAVSAALGGPNMVCIDKETPSILRLHGFELSTSSAPRATRRTLSTHIGGGDGDGGTDGSSAAPERAGAPLLTRGSSTRGLSSRLAKITAGGRGAGLRVGASDDPCYRDDDADSLESGTVRGTEMQPVAGWEALPLPPAAMPPPAAPSHSRTPSGGCKQTRFRQTTTYIEQHRRQPSGSGGGGFEGVGSGGMWTHEELALKRTPMAPHELLGENARAPVREEKLQLWVRPTSKASKSSSNGGGTSSGSGRSGSGASGTSSGEDARQLTLSHGDFLVLTAATSEVAATLEVVPATSTSPVNASPARGRHVARAERHGGAWWLVDVAVHTGEKSSRRGRRDGDGIKRASKGGEGGRRGERSAKRTRRIAQSCLCVHVPPGSTTMTLPLGGALVLGSSVYRLRRPSRELRVLRERWTRLAVCVSGMALAGASEFHVLPTWPELQGRPIGRSLKGALALRDLKVRLRHLRLHCAGLASFGDDGHDGCLNANSLLVKPDKGKPCKLLLGGAGRTLREPWRLQPGDIFCVGLTQLRVACMSVPMSARKHDEAETPSQMSAVGVGVYRMLNDDGRRYRRREAKEAKRALKLQKSDGNDDGDADNDLDGDDKGGDDESSGTVVATCIDELVDDDDDDDDDAVDDDALQSLLMHWEDGGATRGRDGSRDAGGDSTDSGGDGSGSESVDDNETSDSPLLRLELVAGPMRGTWVDFEGGGGTIGTSPNCTLPLENDLTVAPLHASISHVDGEWFVSDLGSRDGTHLLLADHGAGVDIGDRLRIGRSEMCMYVRLARPGANEVSCSLRCASACAGEVAVCMACHDEQSGADDVWTRMNAPWLLEHAQALRAATSAAPRRTALFVMSCIASVCLLLVATAIAVPLGIAASYDPCAALKSRLLTLRNASDVELINVAGLGPGGLYAYGSVEIPSIPTGAMGRRRLISALTTPSPTQGFEEELHVLMDGLTPPNCTAVLDALDAAPSPYPRVAGDARLAALVASVRNGHLPDADADLETVTAALVTPYIPPRMSKGVGFVTG